MNFKYDFQLENDEGTWISLSTESIRLFCSSKWFPSEAWCLQFNQHIGKTLLQAVDNVEISDTIDNQTKNQP
jgi:RCR-type E3 ubiquitin transferase